MTLKKTVRVAFIDVGQGDTIVVSVPETHEAVIIDCLDAEAVISYLEKYDIRHIRGLIVTHLHLDHYKGIMGLIANVKNELNLTCERVLFYFPKVEKKVWERIKNDEDGHSNSATDKSFRNRQSKDILTELYRWTALNRDRFNSLSKQPGIRLPLPEIIELIHPWEVDTSMLIGRSLNDISAILKINGSGTSAILTGDMEPPGWDYLKKIETEITGDVLKFPHHGAWKNCDPDMLLKTISPSVVVISVGTDGTRYNHPNPHAFESLKNNAEIRVLCTQATSLCAMEIECKRNDLIRQHEQYNSEMDTFFVEQKGCPCAGTVIIELGNSLKILQPNVEFHKKLITNSKFLTPQCF